MWTTRTHLSDSDFSQSCGSSRTLKSLTDTCRPLSDSGIACGRSITQKTRHKACWKINEYKTTLQSSRRSHSFIEQFNFKGNAIAGSVKQASKIKTHGLHNQKEGQGRRRLEIHELEKSYVSLCVICWTLIAFANLLRWSFGFGVRSISCHR
jgi:hypothetical protein